MVETNENQHNVRRYSLYLLITYRDRSGDVGFYSFYLSLSFSHSHSFPIYMCINVYTTHIYSSHFDHANQHTVPYSSHHQKFYVCLYLDYRLTENYGSHMVVIVKQHWTHEFMTRHDAHTSPRANLNINSHFLSGARTFISKQSLRCIYCVCVCAVLGANNAMEKLGNSKKSHRFVKMINQKYVRKNERLTKKWKKNKIVFEECNINFDIVALFKYTKKIHSHCLF